MMIKVVDGNLLIFGMSLPKILIIGILTAIVQVLNGDINGAVNTVLIALGIQGAKDGAAAVIKK